MLDKLKLVAELQKSISGLFQDTSLELDAARRIFEWLCDHPEIHELIKKLQSPYPVPLWRGALQAVFCEELQKHPYGVVATDGSQIYPDKHQGVSCYLINTGVVQFVYGHKSSVRLFSEPTVVTSLDDPDMTEDMVNCRRGELEFERGLIETSKARAAQPDIPHLYLCDGSLIFWHLEAKSPQVKERFLKRYIELLDGFYKERLLIAGYISLPKSKELVALLRNCISQGLVKELITLDTIIDTHLTSFFLPVNHRTTVFTHNSALAESYPPHLVPCFVYLHLPTEIARIEIPRWVAQDPEALSTVIGIIKDQATKGNGYPVALSEAHEQAVVKGPDREFFFDMVYKLGITHNQRLHPSQKSLKKRFVSV